MSDQPGGTFTILRSDATDIALAAARADTIDPIDFRVLKLVATSAVAADRVFNITGREWE